MGQRTSRVRPAEAVESGTAEADEWAAQAAQVQAWLPAWDAWWPDDGRPQAAWRAAQEYAHTGTPEARAQLVAAQAACQAACQVSVKAYWVRREHMVGAEVAFQVAL